MVKKIAKFRAKATAAHTAKGTRSKARRPAKQSNRNHGRSARMHCPRLFTALSSNSFSFDACNLDPSTLAACTRHEDMHPWHERVAGCFSGPLMSQANLKLALRERIGTTTVAHEDHSFKPLLVCYNWFARQCSLTIPAGLEIWPLALRWTSPLPT